MKRIIVTLATLAREGCSVERKRFMKRIIAAITASAALASPAAAAAPYYPQPWHIVQLGNACSVTAMGIQRVLTTPNHFALSFGAGTSCSSSPSNKSLVVELQILVPNEGWYPKATIQKFNVKSNPLRLVGSVNIAGSGLSRNYRIAATATDTHNGVTKTATAFSKPLKA